MVRRELPASIYRCKGIVYTDEFPDQRFALQAVGRRVEILKLGSWGTHPPRNRLVAIGSSLNALELNEKFDACLAHS
jgi:G3E family GTPase